MTNQRIIELCEALRGVPGVHAQLREAERKYLAKRHEGAKDNIVEAYRKMQADLDDKRRELWALLLENMPDVAARCETLPNTFIFHADDDELSQFTEHLHIARCEAERRMNKPAKIEPMTQAQLADWIGKLPGATKPSASSMNRYRAGAGVSEGTKGKTYNVEEVEKILQHIATIESDIGKAVKAAIG